MLRQLILRDFVLVDELELDLHAGFTVLTGETGAGKSILIDALQLALGGRSDAGVVREGQTRAEISVAFSMPEMTGIKHWLADAGFDQEEDELLLRRTIDSQGKSRAWINGSPATIGQLRELGEFLVDIHGQHAWQSLTKPERVRELLDAYGLIDNSALLPLWQQWQQAENRLRSAQDKALHADRERERLNWQIEEVDKLAPRENEWDELNTEHERLSHAQMLLDAAQTSCNALSEEGDSASDRLGQAIIALQKAATIDPQLADILKVVQDAQALAEDAHHSLNTWLRHTDLDPQRLEELDQRIASWLSLARRYRRQPQELPALLQSWQQELAELEASSDIAALEKTAEQAKKTWLVAAQQVSAQRQQAAPKLSKAITAAMQGLGMVGGRFEVAITPLPQPQASGINHIEFLVAGHTGSTPRPVNKVASGGELSRLALAIAVTTSQLGHTPTLIFDEIDSGIGGSVAQTVGLLMQQLGKERQVLAVTHLPQVAASAHHHWVVSKQTSGKTTTSRITPVSESDRVTEIARMLGGDATSQAGLAHAQEMLHAAHTGTR